jgi:hypothetical protein
MATTRRETGKGSPLGTTTTSTPSQRWVILTVATVGIVVNF